MITKEGIIAFYDQYKKNLDEENRISDTILAAATETEWIQCVREKNGKIHKLYEQNKELLNQYIYPYLNGEREFSDDTAQIYMDQIYMYCAEGYSDRLAGINIADKLLDYYNAKNDTDTVIKLLSIIGVLCSHTSDAKSLERAVECFEKEAEYIKDYFSFENVETRRRLRQALYNICITKLNYLSALNDHDEATMLDWEKHLMERIHDAMNFYNNEKVRELDGENENLDEKIEALTYAVCGNLMCEIPPEQKVEEEFLQYTTNTLVKMHDDFLKENSDIHAMNDEIYCNYLICRYRNNKIEINDMIESYFEFCRYCLENDEINLKEGFYDTRFFHVCMYRLPFMIPYLELSTLSDERQQEIILYTIEKFLDMMEWLPRFRSSVRVSSIIASTAMILVPYLPPNISAYFFLLKIVINRDENTMLHSAMVRQISYIILNSVIDKRPDLLVGINGYENVAEVLENQDEIFDYVRKASLIFDIGKIQISDLIQKESRDLTQEEFQLIRTHPSIGYELIAEMQGMEKYEDIIIGHHKYYDGTGGYPEDFDNTKSSVRFLIDLIRICDCMDAASDSIGRTFREVHKFENFQKELIEGAGTLYNPDIVELLTSDKKLQQELYDCCVTSRDRVYYETYYELFTNKAVEERKHEKEKKNTIPAWARNAMRVQEIDFYHDTIKTLYTTSKSDFGDDIDGKFKVFVNEKLKPRMHPNDIPKLRSLLEYGSLADKLNLNNGSWELEIRMRFAEEYKWVRMQFTVTEEHFGIPETILLSVIDVDEQCRKRQKLNEALAQAREEAKQANRAKSLFISNISHEIRTPMNAIVGMVEIMLREDLNDREKEYLMNIRNSGNALLSIINDILDFSKMESGKLEIVDDEYEIGSLLNDISMILLNRIGEKPVELIYDIDKSIPEIMFGDAVRIRQVILNLMNNAIKFTDKGMVRLRIKVNKKEEDMIELALDVQDSGIGIKEEEIPKLFGAFQQVDIKRNHQMEGTGLGLVISKQLVELMGGHISVSSEYGAGTTFHFTIKQRVVSNKHSAIIDKSRWAGTIPKIGCIMDNKLLEENIIGICKMFDINCRCLHEQETQAKFDYIFCDQQHLSYAKRAYSHLCDNICVLQNPMLDSIKDDDVRVVNKPLSAISFCQIINDEDDRVINANTDQYLDFVAPDAKVLIVDDTEMNLTVAKGLLAPLKLQIDTADNGLTAIDMVQAKEYDLIFMDHKMPVMDGIESAEHIRKLPGDYYKKVPIIALTANAVLDARRQFEEAGMNDFVAKPIEMKTICSKIKKWLRKDLIIKQSNMQDIAEQSEDIELPDIPGIDVKEAVRNAGTYELLTTLLCDYYNLIDLKSDKIRNLLAEGLIHEYTVEVHALKSVSRVIGATQLSEKFKQLEEWGDKELTEKLYMETPAVLKEYNAYKIYLKDFVAEHTVEATNEIAKDDLISIFETIAGAMQNCDLDEVDNCMDKLSQCKLPDVCKSKMNKLKLLVADVNMEEVIALVNEMAEDVKKSN